MVIPYRLKSTEFCYKLVLIIEPTAIAILRRFFFEEAINKSSLPVLGGTPETSIEAFGLVKLLLIGKVMQRLSDAVNNRLPGLVRENSLHQWYVWISLYTLG